MFYSSYNKIYKNYDDIIYKVGQFNLPEILNKISSIKNEAITNLNTDCKSAKRAGAGG